MKNNELRGELYRLPDVPISEVPDEVVEVVNAEMLNPKYDFRTIRGIVDATEADPAHVASVLTYGGVARATHMIRHGERLYARSDQPISRKERLNIFLAIISRS